MIGIHDIKVFKMRTTKQLEGVYNHYHDFITYIVGRNHLELKITGEEIQIEVFLDGNKVLLTTFIHQDLGLHSEISRVNQLLQHCGFFVSAN